MPQWLQTLVNFFVNNQVLLASLAAAVAVLAAVLRGWRRVFNWIKSKPWRNPPKKATDFPFEVVTNPDLLLDRLLPAAEQQVILDRSVKYIPGRVTGLDKLFEEHGRILIRGRSKAGKTREMAELIRRHWQEGPTVLLLRPNAILEPPFVPPEGLPYRNVILVVNDVDHYCAFTAPRVTSDGAATTTTTRSFPQRLHESIKYFEMMCGSATEVRVVATVRREPEFWDTIEYDFASPSWNSIQVYELSDLPMRQASDLIGWLSEETGISVTDDARAVMSVQNDGTFLNIILKFRDWTQAGTKLIDRAKASEFEGKLATTWQKRYESAVKANPLNRYIYAAIDILRRIGLPPYRYLVAELATRLAGGVTPSLSRGVQRQTRRTWERINSRLGRNRLVKQIAEQHPRIRNRFVKLLEQLEKTRLGSAINRYMLYEVNSDAVTGGSASIQKALRRLVSSEIPIQNEILLPYDGQVDGRGEEWLKSDVVMGLIAEQSAHDDHLVYGMIALSDNLYEDHNYAGALQLLNKAIEILPSYPYARSRRTRVLRALNENDAALVDIDVWLQLDPLDFVAFAQKAVTLASLGRFDDANVLIDKAITLYPGVAWLYELKGDILCDHDKFAEAHKFYDEAISRDPGRFWTYGSKAIALRKEGRYDNAISMLNKGIDLKSDEDWLWDQKGRTLLEAGRYDDALVAFDKAIELDPKAAWIQGDKGITLLEAGSYDDALAAFDKAIELDPKEAWIHQQKGVTLRKVERYDDALAAFDKAIELGPKEARCFYQRSLLFQLQGQVEQARTDLTAAIEIAQKTYMQAPCKWNNVFKLALYHLAAGNTGDSERLYREGLTGGALQYHIDAAIQGLDDFSTVYPGHSGAQALRGLLALLPTKADG